MIALAASQSACLGSLARREKPASQVESLICTRALSAAEVQQLYQHESVRTSLLKAVKPSFANLAVGTNYQLQVSADLTTWTNAGSAFMATNTSMVYPQYWDVDNWGELFFRLQVAP